MPKYVKRGGNTFRYRRCGTPNNPNFYEPQNNLINMHSCDWTPTIHPHSGRSCRVCEPPAVYQPGALTHKQAAS